MLTIASTSSYHLPLARKLTMSMSDNYLNRLHDKSKVPNKNDIQNLIKTAQSSTEPHVNVTEVYLNIHKFDSIVLRRNTRSVMFHLPRELTELYYYNNSTLSKVSDSTKLTFGRLKHFVITDLSCDADGIVF